jgi:hypothetical protein
MDILKKYGYTVKGFFYSFTMIASSKSEVRQRCYKSFGVYPKEIWIEEK